MPYKQHEYLHHCVPYINILKTEYLNTDLKIFFARYGKNIEISTEKIRENKQKVSVLWTPEMKNIVYDYYKKDFDVFRYKK